MSTIKKSTVTKANELKGSIQNILIALVTGGAQAITKIASYRCPCVDSASLSQNCRLRSTQKAYGEQMVGSSDCSISLNYLYGLSYVIGPAVAVFFMGIAVQPKLWKSITGWYKRSDRPHGKWTELFTRLSETTGMALISPLTWVCVSLIDGEHLSCAITSLPYDVGSNGSTYSNCTEVSAVIQSDLVYSELYYKNEAYFQSIGWICTAITVLVGFKIFCCKRCGGSHSHSNKTFHEIFKDVEDEVLKEHMTAKAVEVATKNAKKFLEEPRDKQTWDKISLQGNKQTHQQHVQHIAAPVHLWVEENVDNDATTTSDLMT